MEYCTRNGGYLGCLRKGAIVALNCVWFKPYLSAVTKGTQTEEKDSLWHKGERR